MRRKHAPAPEAVDSPLKGERNSKVKALQLGLVVAGIVGAAKFQNTPGLSIIALTLTLLVAFGINTFRRAGEGKPVTPFRVVTVSLLALSLGMGLSTAKATRPLTRDVTTASSTMAGAMSAGGVDIVVKLGGRVLQFVIEPVKSALGDAGKSNG